MLLDLQVNAAREVFEVLQEEWALRANVDQQEAVVSQVLMDLQALRVRVVTQAPLAPMVRKVVKATLVLQAYQVAKACEGPLVYLVPLAKLVGLETEVHLELMANLVTKDLKEFRVFPDLWDLLVHLDQSVSLAKTAILVRLVQQAPEVTQERMVLRGPQAWQGQQVLLASEVPLVLQVLVASKVFLVLLEFLVLMERTGRLVCRVLGVCLVVLVFVVSEAFPENEVLKVPQVKPANVERVAKVVLMDLQVLLVHQDKKVILVPLVSLVFLVVEGLLVFQERKVNVDH